MSTILVTGAAGFIGSHTCDCLLQRGHRVIGVDNFRTGKRSHLQQALSQQNFVLKELDVSETECFSRLLGEIAPDAVIHLAALVSVQESFSNPQLNYHLNVHATQMVVEAIRRQRVSRLVFASSAAIYGTPMHVPISEDADKCPISPYGSAKLTSELLLHSYATVFGMAVRCLRYFNVYGPRQDANSPYSGVISVFQNSFGETRAPTIFGDGEQTRDFISVHDVARANVLAATASNLGSGSTNICTGQATSLNGLASAMRDHYPDAPAPTYGSARKGDIRHSLGDAARAQRELGFVAEISLPEGLRELCRSRPVPR